MGLISKIEDKLTGGSNSNDASKASKEGEYLASGHGNSSNSGGVSNLAQHEVPGQQGGVAGTAAKYELQHGQHSGSGGFPGRAENAIPGQHSSNSGSTIGRAETAIPGQHSSSSGGVVGRAENAIPGQHSSNTGSHGVTGGQHSSSTGASNIIPGQHSSTTGSSGAYDTSSRQGGAGSSLRHPIGSSTGTGSGITGGTAVTGAGLAGAGLAGSQGSHGTHGSTGYGRDDQNISSTTDRLHNTHLGNSTTSGTTGTSSTDHATPRQPFDPYSSKGQQIAANAADNREGYGASQGRAEAGDYGSRSNVPVSDVHRTSSGGVSNGFSSSGLKTGPHSHLENRDAVPTAGGQKLGAGTTGSHVPGSFDSYDNERGQGHTGLSTQSQGQSGYTGPASNTIGPHSSNIANVVDPRVQPDPALQSSSNQHQQHHTGRDAALAGGAGAAGAAALGSSHDHQKHDGHHTSGHHHQKETTSSHPSGGYSTSDATRGAYEQPSSHHTGSHSTTSNTAPYGQNVSYMNRQPVDEPLSQDKSFIERHPAATTAGVGAGAGALGAGALHHQSTGLNTTTQGGAYDQDRGLSQHNILSQTSGVTGSSLPSQTSGVTGSSFPSHSSNTTGLSHSSNPLSSTGAGASKPSEGLSIAKRLGGAYEAGYRDALEHMRQEREGH